jgi:hypothetical protein
MREIAMENYWIDSRLKRGRDYPRELPDLTFVFNEKTPPGVHLNGRRAKVAFEKNVSRIERTFKEFFLNHCKKEECIRRVNAKLKLINPVLSRNEKGGYDFKEIICGSNIAKRDPYTGGEGIECWVWLAKVIAGLDPKLLHQCLHCQNYFFSRQRQDYHPECKPKFFLEKYKKDGRQKGWEKESRKRKRGQLTKTR